MSIRHPHLAKPMKLPKATNVVSAVHHGEQSVPASHPQKPLTQGPSTTTADVVHKHLANMASKAKREGRHMDAMVYGHLSKGKY